MTKLTLALGVVVVVLVAEASCQKFILPTYRPPTGKRQNNIILPTFRPPPKQNPIRYVREAHDEPLWLNKGDIPKAPASGDHPVLPKFIDDIKPDPNRRYARSLDSPSAKRGGGSPRSSSGSRNTGATHPGYNRRNAREIRLPGHLNPRRPKPLFPRPSIPAPVPRIPILARTARDVQLPGVRAPSHRDVIIPNWNPNVKTSPWQRFGVKQRTGRSIDFPEDMFDNSAIDGVPHERETRDVSGLPKKPTHRDVVIPNWNPHARTNPWQRIGGGRH